MKTGSSRGWIYEDGTVVPDDILDIIDWGGKGKTLSADNVTGNVNPVAVAIIQAAKKMRLIGATLIVVMLVFGLRPLQLLPQ